MTDSIILNVSIDGGFDKRLSLTREEARRLLDFAFKPNPQQGLGIAGEEKLGVRAHFEAGQLVLSRDSIRALLKHAELQPGEMKPVPLETVASPFAHYHDLREKPVPLEPASAHAADPQAPTGGSWCKWMGHEHQCSDGERGEVKVHCKCIGSGTPVGPEYFCSTATGWARCEHCGMHWKVKDHLPVGVPSRAPAIDPRVEEINQLRGELAAYKKAKAENDERFMIERDEARAEAAKRFEELTQARTEQNNLRDELNRLKNNLGWMERGWDKAKAEVERLKAELEIVHAGKLFKKVHQLQTELEARGRADATFNEELKRVCNERDSLQLIVAEMRNKPAPGEMTCPQCKGKGSFRKGDTPHLDSLCRIMDERDEARAERDIARTNENKLNQELERVRAERYETSERLRKEVDKLEEEKKQFISEYNKLKAKLRESERQCCRHMENEHSLHKTVNDTCNFVRAEFPDITWTGIDDAVKMLISMYRGIERTLDKALEKLLKAERELKELREATDLNNQTFWAECPDWLKSASAGTPHVALRMAVEKLTAATGELKERKDGRAQEPPLPFCHGCGKSVYYYHRRITRGGTDAVWHHDCYVILQEKLKDAPICPGCDKKMFMTDRLVQRDDKTVWHVKCLDQEVARVTCPVCKSVIGKSPSCSGCEAYRMTGKGPTQPLQPGSGT